VTVERAKLVLATPGRQGEQGVAGPAGATGEPGVVISPSEPDDLDVLWADTSEVGDAVLPLGGSAGQSLVKVSGDDYDTDWETLVPTGGSAGQVLVKQSATDYDAAYAQVNDVGLELGVTSGDSLPLPDGGTRFYGFPQSLVNTSVPARGGAKPRVDYSPWLAPRPMLITSALTENTAVAGGTFSLYIWDADEDWQPVAGTSRLIALNVSTASAAVSEFTGLSISIPAGRYVTGCIVDGANVVLRTWHAAVPSANVMTTSSVNLTARALFKAGASFGDKWNAEQPISTGGVMQPVLFKWEWV
jgi:hypothetical protein